MQGPLPHAFPSLPPPLELTQAEETYLACLAAHAVEACASGLREPPWACEGEEWPEAPCSGEPPLPPEGVRRSAGVFVTVFEGEDLRGCLGMAEGREPLREAVPRLAWAAASRDLRFEPISREELPRVRIEITLLGDLTRLPSDPAVLLRELDPEVCGLQIMTPGRTGLLLPQVARRLGWDARELLEQVSRKAGLDRNAWGQPGSRLYGFRARSFDAVRSGDLPRDAGGAPPATGGLEP